MPFLRQSTIQTIRFGPFLDASDGVTEEVALTITQALRRISKDGGDFGQSGETGNSTHDENGWYFDDLTAADTDTVGELVFYVADPTTHLPVWLRWWVIEEDIYDAIFGAAAAGFDSNGRVDLGLWVGVAPNALNSGAVEADVQRWLDAVPNALVSNRVDASVGAMAANVLTAAAINAAALIAAKFGTDAITSTVLAASAAEKIRDAILPEQNVALSDIPFLLVATSDHVTPVTGATGLGVTRSIDGGSFGAGTGTIAEIGNGMYQYDASAADMNGGKITFRFVATGGTPGAADDRFLTVVTGAGV